MTPARVPKQKVSGGLRRPLEVSGSFWGSLEASWSVIEASGGLWSLLGVSGGCLERHREVPEGFQAWGSVEVSGGFWNSFQFIFQFISIHLNSQFISPRGISFGYGSAVTKEPLYILYAAESDFAISCAPTRVIHFSFSSRKLFCFGSSSIQSQQIPCDVRKLARRYAR